MERNYVIERITWKQMSSTFAEVEFRPWVTVKEGVRPLADEEHDGDGTIFGSRACPKSTSNNYLCPKRLPLLNYILPSSLGNSWILQLALQTHTNHDSTSVIASTWEKQKIFNPMLLPQTTSFLLSEVNKIKFIRTNSWEYQKIDLILGNIQIPLIL